MVKIQFKRGPASRLPATGQPGEPFYDEDNNRLFIAGKDGQVRPLSVAAADLDGMGFDAVLYVSARYGTPLGTGSYTNPFSTLAAAVASIAPAAERSDFEKHFLLFIIDAETYAEDVVVPPRRVSITGAGATIQGTLRQQIDAGETFGSTLPVVLNIASSVAAGDGRDAEQTAVQGLVVRGGIVTETVGTPSPHSVILSGVRVEGGLTFAAEGRLALSRSKVTGAVAGSPTVSRMEGSEVDGAATLGSVGDLLDVAFGAAVTVNGSFTGSAGLRFVEFKAGSPVSIPNAAAVKMDASTIRTFTKAVVTAPALVIERLQASIGIAYDGETSGLAATNVQEAIDQVKARTDVIDGGSF